MIFHETAAENDGELVRVETVVRPHGFVAAAHVHPAQTEHFRMLEGTVEFRVGREVLRASAGDEVVVPPGTPHRFRNTGDDDARFLMEVRPARKFESLIETMFTLAAEGKTGKRGLPGPFRLAVIAREHFDTVQLPFPPPALQKAALAVGAPLGRAFGYKPTVERLVRTDSRSERRRGYDRGRPHGSPGRRPDARGR
ncbi:MAG TPA: cupin domain-containing protein [Gaiellaceae bacterium]|nr:cupin domain-containing protein [Gaiellaceae bacterium]